MTRAGRIIALILVLAAVGVGALFTVQNGGRTTDLSLDLWLVAYHLEEPQPIPHLLWAAFGGGLLIGGVWGLLGRMGAGRRMRDLEDQVSQPGYAPSDDDWT